jgi:hypothetical protein
MSDAWNGRRPMNTAQARNAVRLKKKNLAG